MPGRVRELPRHIAVHVTTGPHSLPLAVPVPSRATDHSPPPAFSLSGRRIECAVDQQQQVPGMGACLEVGITLPAERLAQALQFVDRHGL